MKVFLDIGAHRGDTLAIAQQPRWGLDRIVCFEPAPNCWDALDELADHRTEVCRLPWSRYAMTRLHNPGVMGASVYADKDPVDEQVACEFRDATQWFRENVSVSDTVFVKINVEGAEADLVERLAQAGLLDRIDHLLIHFDVRKVPSQRTREAVTSACLQESGIDFAAAEDIQFGIVTRGTTNWLRWCHSPPGLRRWVRHKSLARGEFAGRRAAHPLRLRLVRAS